MKNRINIYGLIAPASESWLRDWGVDRFSMTFPQDILEALEDADPNEDLNLYIDSIGGYIDAGNSIIAHIQDWCAEHNRVANVTVGGMAASMAAVTMVSFTGTIKVHNSSVVMFHGARTAVWDDQTASQLRDTAEALDVFNHSAARALAKRTGKSEEEVFAWIDGTNETWLGPVELKAHGIDVSIIGEAPTTEPSITLPGAGAVASLRRNATASRDIGGLLAAAACATAPNSNKDNPMAKKKKATQASSEPVVTAVEEEETPVTTTEEETAASEPTSEDPIPEEEETPAEEVPAEEPAEEPTEEPAEETAEETPEEEEEAPAEEEPADAIATAVAQALEIVKGELDTLRAENASLKEKLATAEGVVNGLRKSGIQAALQPAPVVEAPTAPAVKADMPAWRALVNKHGGNIATAAAENPALYEAIKRLVK